MAGTSEPRAPASESAQACVDPPNLSERQSAALEKIRAFEHERRVRWDVPPWDIEAIDVDNDPCLREIEDIDPVVVLQRQPTWGRDWAAIYVPTQPELRVTLCSVRARFKRDGKEIRVFVAAPSVIVFADRSDDAADRWLPKGLRVLLRYSPQEGESSTDNHIDYAEATTHRVVRWLPLYLKNAVPVDYLDIDLSYVSRDMLTYFPDRHRPYVGATASLVPFSVIDSELATLLGHIVVGRLAWAGN